MATNDVTITYKNFCVPQELDSTSAKWYLDSDCGRKLSGSSTLTPAAPVSLGSTIRYYDTTSTLPVDIGTGNDFFYLKCIAGDYVKLSFDGGSNYIVSLLPGQAFASYIDSSAADIKFDSSGSSTVQYMHAT